MNRNIDYFAIIKKSIKVVWKKKILVIFGVFVFLGSFGSGFYVNIDDKETERAYFDNITSLSPQLIPWMIMALLIMVVALIFLRAIGIASLIKFAGGNLHQKGIGFSALFRIGKALSLKIITLDVVIGLIMFVMIAVLSVPVLALIFSKSYLAAFLIGFSALVIFIPILVLLFFIKMFSYIFIVTIGGKLKESAEKAYLVFRENIFISIIFSMMIGIIGVVMMFVPILFFAFLEITLNLSDAWVSIFNSGDYLSRAVLISGIIMVAVLFFIVGGFFESFRQVAWVIFLKELAGIKKEKEELQREIVLAQDAKTEHV